ncbi:MAG: type II toxin-antitoxin system RelE/ParE family toxin [Desulfobulbaceae bacterium]|nr:type II toxin-antitoxin system RelE/ParE family toxin [Desulfobulbaceae bacterium]
MADLASLRNYIAEDNPIAARKMALRISDRVNFLVDQPL